MRSVSPSKPEIGSRRWPRGWPHGLPLGTAIYAVFFVESSVLGQWIPRIPDIKQALGLDDASLGLALLCMPLATLLGLSLAGRVIERMGLRGACRVFLPIWALLFLLPGLVTSFAGLCLALAAAGMAIGMIETAMNTEAARLETHHGVRLMSRCHGFWSLGSMVGALMGGAVAQAGVSVSTHFLVAMPLLAVLGYAVATALEPDPDAPGATPAPAPTIDPATQAVPQAVTQTAAQTLSDANSDTTSGASPRDAADAPLFTLPSRALLPLCVMPLGLMMLEGVFIDWSAVFVREILEASPLAIAVIYAAFSCVMATVRLSGDWLAERVGDARLVRASAVAGLIGTLTFALAPTVTVAFIGAAFAGAGVAVVFPLAVSAAAARPGRNSADNVAALNMVSFSAFLFAPPLIGFLSHAFDLRVAILALVPGALLSLYLSRELLPRAPATGPADRPLPS